MQDFAGEGAVGRALEASRKAMLAGDAAQLGALCMDELTYGHTSGLLQTKAEFIADIAGRTAWKSITFSDISNCVVGDTAISRYTFTGENSTDGKTNPVKFSTVMVWKKQGEQWKLLVRQAFNKVI